MALSHFTGNLKLLMNSVPSNPSRRRIRRVAQTNETSMIEILETRRVLSPMIAIATPGGHQNVEVAHADANSTTGNTTAPGTSPFGFGGTATLMTATSNQR